MPGGPLDAYNHVRLLLESLAARINEEPCIAWLGPGSAGHYTKMVHNGIEYGIMRLISETYDLMKRGMGLNDDELSAVYDKWNASELNSYLIEITAKIFCRPDEFTDKRLIDMILDRAAQKGTGRWTSQDAMDIGVPVPTIDIAVSMRELSDIKSERTEAGRLYRNLYKLREKIRIDLSGGDIFLEKLRNALYCAMIITYAQGFALLRKASETYGYGMPLEVVARIWRGGCIIRSAFLEKIMAAFRANPGLLNILLDRDISGILSDRQEDMRFVIETAAALGIPIAAFMSSLSYFDAYRSEWMPANLIQAQRDFFGAHGYSRLDAEGPFHTQWEKV